MSRVSKPHKYVVPSNYDQIKKVRDSGKLSVKSCPYLKESTQLRDYQTVGCLNMAIINHMILADDPGLGKTLETLTAYGIAKNANKKLKLVVFTTKSSKSQWGGEIDRFMVGISYHVLQNNYKPKGSKKKLTGREARLSQYEEMVPEVDVFITGYYPLQIEPHQLAQAFGEDTMIVFDEVQALKNHKSKAHLGAEIIVKSATRVYGLTATPIKNRLLEFYYIFRIIVPDLFPGVTKWRDEFTIQEMKFIPQKGGKPKRVKEIKDYKNLDLFKSIIDPYFLKRSAEDVAKDLPGIISKKIEVQMSPAQARLYADAIAGIVYEGRVRQTYHQMMSKVEEAEESGTDLSEKFMGRYERICEKYEEILAGDFLKKNKNSALGFCQLISNGPQWLDPNEEGSSSKEEAFSDLMDGELYGSKVIVFTRFKSGIYRLRAITDKLGLKSVRVTGDENDKQRTEAMRVFQDKESDVEVIFITEAGSAAINLQTSGVLVFYDTPWSWGDLVQIIGRARRLGSDHANVLVYHMSSIGTIDDRVLDVLVMKKKLNEKILGVQASGALAFNGVVADVPDDFIDERGEVNILFDEIFS